MTARQVTMWFDPGCPYTWRTSRWLTGVAAERGLTVDWRVMSLAILNEHREIPEQYREAMRLGVAALRVLAATRQAHGTQGLGSLYAAIGRRIHQDGRSLDRTVLSEGLAEAGLPAGLLAAADDPAADEAVRASHDEGQQRTGQESGSPVLAMDDGPGFFGPIVVEAPTGDEAMRLFDGLALLSSVPLFVELKRAREEWKTS
jgi:2-hydroxychromene-2-carboxylate isomerase